MENNDGLKKPDKDIEMNFKNLMFFKPLRHGLAGEKLMK